MIHPSPTSRAGTMLRCAVAFVGLCIVIGIPALVQASAGQLLTYKVAGAGSHLWVVPNNWQIVAGQGTNQITVIIGATLPGTVRVAAVDACGAGAETAIQIGQQ